MSTLMANCDRAYPLVHAEMIETTIVDRDGESTADCPAQLCEISPSSAKLVVQGPPELSARCRVRLVSSKLAEALEFPARIDWVRPNSAGDWLVECEFQPRLAEEDFGLLLASGLLERRASVRYQTRIPVDVQWLPGAARISGTVRDLSEGGLCLCLVTREPPPETREMRVFASTPQGEAPLALKIRWSLQVGPDYLIGCQFVHGRDFETLRKQQPSRGFRERSGVGQSRERR